MSMKRTIFFVLIALFSCLAMLLPSCQSDASGGGSSDEDEEDNIAIYSEVTGANPLKGFVCWEGGSSSNVPCSLEYIPVAFDKLLTAENTCDFSYLETKLENARERQHQTILRVLIDDTGTATYPHSSPPCHATRILRVLISANLPTTIMNGF